MLTILECAAIATLALGTLLDHTISLVGYSLRWLGIVEQRLLLSLLR